MILIESGEQNERALDGKILFATQLSQRGHPAVIDDRSIPGALDRNQKFDVAKFLADIGAVNVSRILVIGAETISDETMIRLRGARAGPNLPVTAIGRFADRQSLIAAQAKIAYATGQEPDVLDLGEVQGKPLVPHAVSPLAASPAPSGQRREIPNLFVFLPQEMLDDPQTLPILGAMDQMSAYRLNVVLPGRGKDQVRGSRHAGLLVHGYAELPPACFARQADIAAFFGDRVPGERMAAFALDMMRSGKVVIDCTSGAGFLEAGAPAVRGPEDVTALAAHIQHTILINRNEIGRQTQASPWLVRHGVERLEQALRLPDPGGEVAAEDKRRRTLMLPTNGIGLGHAQRCTLVAAEAEARRDFVFAAFPSCIGLIKDKGFDCLPLVQKSPDHPEEHANDLLTYLRLSRLLKDGDRLIFDGGYVFDSIYRLVQEKALDAVWIRRGLWRAGQSLRAPIERERIFDRLIVPGEAFEELNVSQPHNRRIHSVGPVVQNRARLSEEERATARGALGERLNHPFDRLAVSMLGGGVAADRTAQMQALAAMFRRRADCLHLVVVWPGAVVPPGLDAWPNTRVVQTRDALGLCQIADLAISAAGYNSFHEMLYHAIPTIFIPQMASYMDDQERRARAASERGLAETVLAHELLLLEREVSAFLDLDKAATIAKALGAAELPERGNRRAAEIVEMKEGVA